MKITSKSLIIALTLGSMVAFSTLQAAEGDAQGKRERPAAAQKGERTPATERIKVLDEAVKLTEAQKAKVKAIYEEQTKKMQEMRNDTSLDQQARRAKWKELSEAVAKKIDEVLTPEQKEKWAAKQKELAAKANAAGKAKREKQQ